MKLVKRAVAVLGALSAGLFASIAFMTTMPGEPSAVVDRPLSGDEAALERRLRAHVQFLASQPRNRRDAPEHEVAVVDYIRRELTQMGYQPTLQPVASADGEFQNIIVRIDGVRHPDELVVVGAHWDTRGPTPGADDNASGVAATLEIARWLRDRKPARSIELAFWANEEPPYFRTDAMGSLVHARALSDQQANVVWMVSLEMLGYFDPSPGSQSYPPVLRAFYPDAGNFVAFVGSMWHRSAVTNAVQAMRDRADFPTYGFAGPESMTGIGFSDHWSFWQVGYPGVMLTDTSFFRTPHYHQLTDTPETLDWVRYPRVVASVIDTLPHFVD